MELKPGAAQSQPAAAREQEVSAEPLKLLVLVAAGAPPPHGRSLLLWLLDTPLLRAVSQRAVEPEAVDAEVGWGWVRGYPRGYPRIRVRGRDPNPSHTHSHTQAESGGERRAVWVSAALVPSLQLLQTLLFHGGACSQWMESIAGQRLLRGVAWCAVRRGLGWEEQEEEERAEQVRILPRPGFPDRRLRVRWDQGRGGYMFTVQKQAFV